MIRATVTEPGRPRSSRPLVPSGIALSAGLAGMCVALVACGSLTEPRGATMFVPPAEFRVHWRIAEACSGVVGDFDDVEWFTTEGSAGGNGVDGVAGSWWSRSNRIYLMEAYVEDGELVRHEMLNALLRGNTHSIEFAGSCRGIVTCVGNCISETGGAQGGPSAGSPVVAPSVLDVSAQVIAPVAGGEGWGALIVSARSLETSAVWVDLSARPGVQFECLVGTLRCGRHFSYGSSNAAFSALETRSEATLFHLPPGSFGIVGAFNNVVLAPIPVSVP